MTTKAEQKSALREAILAVANAAAELAVYRNSDDESYECAEYAQSELYRAEDKLDDALVLIFGVDDD